MMNLRILATGIVAMVLGTGAFETLWLLRSQRKRRSSCRGRSRFKRFVSVPRSVAGSKVYPFVKATWCSRGNCSCASRHRSSRPSASSGRPGVQGMSAALDKARSGARPEEKEAAQAAVEAAQARYECLKAGSRGEEIRQAEAELKREEATLAVAQHEVRRSSSLLVRNAGTSAEYDSTHAEYERSLARVNAAKAHLDRLVAGSRKEEIDEAAAELKRARANALLLQKGNRAEDIAQAEAALAEARGKLREIEAQLAGSVVRAAEPAVVEVLAVRKGDLVGPNQTILRVLRADDLWVKVYVPETELGRIRLGQDVEVTIDSAPGQAPGRHHRSDRRRERIHPA